MLQLDMMEQSSRNNGGYHKQKIPLWVFVSLSMLFTGLTVVGIMADAETYERKLDAYSSTRFIKETPVKHNRRDHRNNKNKLRRRLGSDATDQIQPFALKYHRADTQHLQEILYFLNHL